MKKYDKIVVLDTDYKPIQDVHIADKLPPGVYEVEANQMGEVYFSKIKTNHDALVDLPDTEYDQVVKEIELFMAPETRALFEENGFVYKRSTLLYGEPGTGKTCIVNRVINKVVSEGGIALFSPNPRLLEESYKILDSLQPETRVLVVFEELDKLISNYEGALLNLLDGEVQKSNIIYVATTNHIDQVPPRIRRPGRFSSVIEVGFPTANTRRFYLNHKLKGPRVNKVNLDVWVETTEGFSIDELKETVLAVRCLNYTLESIVSRIKQNRSPEASDQESEYDDIAGGYAVGFSPMDSVSHRGKTNKRR